MAQPGDVERYRENWQDEIDSAAEYRAMAESEPDPKIAKVYSNLASMEEAHIAFWEEKLRSAGEKVGERRPSWRSRVVAWIARRLGDITGHSGIVEIGAHDRLGCSQELGGKRGLPPADHLRVEPGGLDTIRPRRVFPSN